MRPLLYQPMNTTITFLQPPSVKLSKYTTHYLYKSHIKNYNIILQPLYYNYSNIQQPTNFYTLYIYNTLIITISFYNP